MQHALKTALAGRTSLVIAHRLSTIREADQILVIDGGRVRERGQHEELLAAGGLYAELYHTQFAEPGAAGRLLGPGSVSVADPAQLLAGHCLDLGHLGTGRAAVASCRAPARQAARTGPAGSTGRTCGRRTRTAAAAAGPAAGSSSSYRSVTSCSADSRPRAAGPSAAPCRASASRTCRPGQVGPGRPVGLGLHAEQRVGELGVQLSTNRAGTRPAPAGSASIPATASRPSLMICTSRASGNASSSASAQYIRSGLASP